MMTRKTALIFTAAILAITMALLPSVISIVDIYSFEMTVPDEVNVMPGETVVIEGEVLVTGMYWLHNFEMTVEGLDYNYNLVTNWDEHVRILRGWNPDDGVFRMPETFELRIDVPEDASGVDFVSITGQEHHSWRQVSNNTYFILNIGGAPDEETVALEIVDIEVPEEIMEFEAFDFSFKVKNKGPTPRSATVSLVVPEGWQLDESSKTYAVSGDSEEEGMFRVIPTTEEGEVALLVEYPFKNRVMNFTKVGPYLVPMTEETTTTTTKPSGNLFGDIYSAITGFSVGIISGITGSFGEFEVPLLVGIIVVLVIVIIWLLTSIFKVLKIEIVSDDEGNAGSAVEISDSGIDSGSSGQITLTEI